MAGGKETPRQKMIGMMYLVLTALLALNVSKTILDAFVAIEENTQKSNITHVDRGNELVSDVAGEFAITKESENKEKFRKLKGILSRMKQVDSFTAKLIREIDELKLEILRESGEAVDSYKPNDKNAILWQTGTNCTPIRMNLMAVEAQDEYDVPMYIIIGDDIKEPTGKGKKLWEDYNDFRSKLVQLLGTYRDGGKSYSITPKAINDFKDLEDLKQQVEHMLKSSKINRQDDKDILSAIYMNLTKPERVAQNDMEGVHWIGQTFDHSPLVAALASLSSLQQDVLSARAMALAHLKSKVSVGNFSFNSIVGLAYGPAVVNSGDEVELSVMMAAFDSDNQPTITYNGASFTGTGGKGLVKAKAGSGSEMVLNGTVSIKNKSGLMKTENWSHTVKIMRPQGTVSLPQLNVLYKGYENRIEGVASGYDQTILVGNGVTLTKSGSQYIGKVATSGKSASIDIYGENSVSKKRVKLGTFPFRVMRLPDPEFFFGAVESGGRIPLGETRLFARYKNSPLDAEFKILNWELTVNSAPRPEKGTGSQISPDAVKLLRQCKPGTIVSFRLDFMGPEKILQKKLVSFVV